MLTALPAQSARASAYGRKARFSWTRAASQESRGRPCSTSRNCRDSGRAIHSICRWCLGNSAKKNPASVQLAPRSECDMPAPRGPRFEGRTRIEHVQRLIDCQGSYANAGCDEPGWDAGHCLITAAGSPCASTRRIFRYPARPANCLAVTRRVAGEKHNVIHLLAAEMAQTGVGHRPPSLPLP